MRAPSAVVPCGNTQSFESGMNEKHSNGSTGFNYTLLLMSKFYDPVEDECQICGELAVRLSSAEDRTIRAMSQLSSTANSEAVRLARADADEIRRQWRERRLLHASGDGR